MKNGEKGQKIAKKDKKEDPNKRYKNGAIKSGQKKGQPKKGQKSNKK